MERHTAVVLVQVFLERCWDVLNQHQMHYFRKGATIGKGATTVTKSHKKVLALGMGACIRKNRVCPQNGNF